MTGPHTSLQAIRMFMKKRAYPLLWILPIWGLSACSTTDQQVEELLEQLAANEIRSQPWQQAVDQLADIGRPAARQLIAHLSPDQYLGEYYREYRAEQEQIRTGAAQALGRIKPRGATAALNACIVAGYTNDERIACLWAVGEIGFDQAGYEALLVQLKDTNPLIRLHAAIAVVKMDEEDGVAEIEAALAGTDDALAGIALQGLEESNFFGVPLLSRLLRQAGSRQPELQGVEERVARKLIAQLKDEEPLIRRRSARALGLLGDTTARSPLLDLLDDPNNLVRFNAAAALASMDDPQGIEFLFAALQNEDSILRANAVKFLIQVQRSSGAVEGQLVAALQDRNPLARAGAAQVLGQAQVAGALQALLSATQDGISEVRCNAVIALGQIGATDSLDRLQDLVKDSDPTVSYYAEWALRQLGQG